jgi:16S rRNA (adenine1518-N6/adenine1519-N6)-dimethyltransferase
MQQKLLPKKSLGQNFLRDEGILSRIAESLDWEKIKPETLVIEIGPGEGTLTKQLLKKDRKIIAIEKDLDAVILLRETFKQEIMQEKIEIRHQDIKDVIFPKKESEYVVIGNIPYYMTSFLMRLFLENEHKPTQLVFCMQKEVAQRIVSREKKESLLSISVKVFGTPKIAFHIKRGSFYPAPKVDSSVLVVSEISNELFLKNKTNQETFFELVKLGFSNARKKLGTNLKDRKIQSQLLEKRAEDLSVEDWFSLL